jgi:transposase InsO family protein
MVDNAAERITRRYTSLPNPEAFSAPFRVSKENNISLGRAAKILSRVEAYSLHRQFRRQKRRNVYYIYFKRQQVQCDLIDVQKLARLNDGKNWIMLCIDGFSRYLWGRALSRKTAAQTVAAMKSMLDEMGRPPKQIFADKGSELKNREMKRLLREREILLIHPQSEMKAGTIERANRTIRSLIWKYMTHYETFRWVDVLQSIIRTYNNRSHRSIDNLTPRQAELEVNKNRVASTLRHRYFLNMDPPNKRPKFKINDVVRIKVNHGMAFARGYEEQFSQELYKVVEVDRRKGVVMYKLRHIESGEILRGRCYESELQLSTEDEVRLNVISRRVRRGVREIQVQMRGYINPIWIREDQITADFRGGPQLQQQQPPPPRPQQQGNGAVMPLVGRAQQPPRPQQQRPNLAPRAKRRRLQ